MRQMIFGRWAALVAAALLILPGQARACKGCGEYYSVPDRVVRADMAVIGKVKSIETKVVQAFPSLGAKEKVDYQVAVVDVSEVLVGKKTAQVRIAWIAPKPPLAPPEPAKDKKSVAKVEPVELTVGQEACFFLVLHFEQPFQLVFAHDTTISKGNNPNFDKDAALARRCARLWADPVASLNGKDTEDRLLTASMLLTRHRTWMPQANVTPKLEPIDAEQSKLILQALMSVAWVQEGKEPPVVAPHSVFYRLGLTAQDGWVPPAQGFKDVKELETVAKKWLGENAGKYRIQGYVADKSVSANR